MGNRISLAFARGLAWLSREARRRFEKAPPSAGAQPADERRAVTKVGALRPKTAPIKTDVPYGTTPRGFQHKNAFADTARLLGSDVDVVFDVGAHGGEEAATYRQLFPAAAVHCFEPTRERAQQLLEEFAADPRVHVHEMALTDRDGSATFFHNPVDATNSLLGFAPQAAAVLPSQYLTPIEKRTVSCITLETICARLNIEQIDLLKLDVQGAERQVFEGGLTLLREHRIRLIYAEVTFVPVYATQTDGDELCVWLKRYGYRLYDFYNFAYAESGRVLWGDAIFLPV